MKLIALIIGVLIWMAIASIPRGTEKKQESWLDLSRPETSQTSQTVQKNLPKESPKATGRPTETTAIPKSHPTELANVHKTVCEKPGDSMRTLVLSLKKNGCELSYEKGSHKETVAQSHFSVKTCEQVKVKITRKLESAGYRCQAETP